MARKRLSMRKIREVLRLKHMAGLSVRAISRACSIGKETAREYVCRASGRRLSSLYPRGRSDKGTYRSLDEDTVQTLVNLKREMRGAPHSR